MKNIRKSVVLWVLLVLFVILGVGYLFGGTFLEIIAQQNRPECVDPDSGQIICFELANEDVKIEFVCEGAVDSYGICDPGSLKEYQFTNNTSRALFIPTKTAEEFLSFKDATKGVNEAVESEQAREHIIRRFNMQNVNPNDAVLTQEAGPLFHDPDTNRMGVTICEVGVDCDDHEPIGTPVVGYCDSHGTSVYDTTCWPSTADGAGGVAVNYEIQWYQIENNDGPLHEWKSFGTVVVDPAGYSNPAFEKGSLIDLLTDNSWPARYTFTYDQNFDSNEYNIWNSVGGGKRVRSVNGTNNGDWEYVVENSPTLAPDYTISATSPSLGVANVVWNLAYNDILTPADDSPYFQYELSRCLMPDETTSAAMCACDPGTNPSCVDSEAIASLSSNTHNDNPDETGWYVYCVTPENPAQTHIGGGSNGNWWVTSTRCTDTSLFVNVPTAGGGGGGDGDDDDDQQGG